MFVMMLVSYRKNKMFQAFGLALLAEMIILFSLWLGVAGLEKLRQKGLATSAIIQLHGALGEQKAHEPQKLQTSLPKPVRQAKRGQFTSKPLISPAVVQRVSELRPSSEEQSAKGAVADPMGGDPFSSEQTGLNARSFGNEDPLVAYAAKVKNAVQAVVEYPADASHLRINARVRVEFALRDGVQKSPRIVKSSGLSVFDRAAMHVVEMAHYPLPPQVLMGQTKSFQVWIEFKR
jgi:TonB family protein